MLLTAMVLAILSFAGAASLVGGDVWIFAVICVLSGATIGADLTLLPALFARRMASFGAQRRAGFRALEPHEQIDPGDCSAGGFAAAATVGI